MAYNVSTKYRTTIYQGEKIYSCSFSINGETISPRQIKEIKISRPIIDTTSESFYVGTFIANKIVVTFRNTDDLNIKSGDEAILSIALKVDGTNEWVPQGTFIIDDLGENYTKSNQITCYDYSVKFEPSVNLKIEEIFDYNEENNSYSITIENLLKRLCTHFKVELGTYPTINRNIVVGNWDSTLSGKQHISWIAEQMAGNVKIGRDNKLYIVPLKSEPVCTINALRSASLEIGEKYHISHVTYFDAIREYTFPLKNMFLFAIKSGEEEIITTGCEIELDGDTYSFTATDTEFSFGSVVEADTEYSYEVGTLYPIETDSQYLLYCTNENFDNNYITAYDENKISLGYQKISDNQTYTPPTNAKYISVSIGISNSEIDQIYETSVVLKVSIEEQNTLQIRQGNMYIVSEEQVKAIYDAVKGLEIYSMKNTNWADVSLDANDIVVYQVGDKQYKTFYNSEITYAQSIKVSLDTKIPTKQQEITTNNVKLNAEESIRKVSAEVNDLTGTITLVSEKVNDNTKNIAQMQITDTEIKTSIENVQKDSDEKFNEVKNSLNEVKTSTYTKTEIQQINNGSYVDENGNVVAVSTVINTSGTFDADGMHYAKTGAKANTTINQNGVEINETQSNNELLYAGFDNDETSVTYGTSVVRTENLTVKKYLRCGGIGRFEEYTDNSYHEGVGFFLEG